MRDHVELRSRSAIITAEHMAVPSVCEHRNTKRLFPIVDRVVTVGRVSSSLMVTGARRERTRSKGACFACVDSSNKNRSLRSVYRSSLDNLFFQFRCKVNFGVVRRTPNCCARLAGSDVPRLRLQLAADRPLASFARFALASFARFALA